MRLLFFLSVFEGFALFAQPYTSYFTGNTVDLDTIGQGGICLMGGATEDDNAMTWFLERANGGDVLVLRTSGSDGYNNYMYSGLGVTINSVETIVCHSAAASNETYVQDAIKNAEAIWFAGGDQWNYISYWRDTPVDSLINQGKLNRNIVIGGTSAGMAIQGDYYFSAQNGTVTSATALNNPFDTDVTVDNTPFIENTILENVITDTHYDNPDRKGRQVTFMARMVSDGNIQAKGIACDEYTAVCIDENGIAHVYGEYPAYDDFAYFLQINCSLWDSDPTPEDCSAGNPLTWDRMNSAVQVYKVGGTTTGNSTLDLNNWNTGNGGSWERWWVDNGTLNEAGSSAIDCFMNLEEGISSFDIFPNPTNGQISITSNKSCSYQLLGIDGSLLKEGNLPSGTSVLDLENFSKGSYLLQLNVDGHFERKIIIRS